MDSFNFETLQNDIRGVENRVLNTEEDINLLKKENLCLKAEVTSLQNYSRKDNVVITGFPETPKEDLKEVFNSLSLAIQSNATSSSLSVIHRIPTRAKSNIKPIVAKFISRQDKDQWMDDFWKIAKTDQTGAGISTTIISRHLEEGRVLAHQHLAPVVLALYKDTKRIASEKGYDYVRVRDSKILVKKEVTSKSVIVISEASDLAKL